MAIGRGATVVGDGSWVVVSSVLGVCFFFLRVRILNQGFLVDRVFCFSHQTRGLNLTISPKPTQKDMRSGRGSSKDKDTRKVK